MKIDMKSSDQKGLTYSQMGRKYFIWWLQLWKWAQGSWKHNSFRENWWSERKWWRIWGELKKKVTFIKEGKSIWDGQCDKW